MISLFAAESGPHIAIAPEHVFIVGGVQVTNSMFYSVISAIAIIILLIKAGKVVKPKAGGGFVQFIEIGTDFVVGILENMLGSSKKAYKYAPIFATIFFFILLNNWFGLLPGVGPAIEAGGVPLLRPYTADLNGTLALAVFGIITVQFLAIREIGIKNHLNHYFGGNFKNPINIFVGILEMFSELTRVISLSFRLFFNILIGEILIAIFTYLGRGASPITTLPFIAMELFVGLVQAYIFTMLVITYLSIATAHDTEHVHEDQEHPIVSPTQAMKEVH